MTSPLRTLLWCGLVLVAAARIHAAPESRDFTAVRHADATRIEATIAADIPRLTALLSDDLSYGLSDGRVQTKAQLLTSVATSRVHFEACDYVDTHLTEIVSGAITMSGRAQIRAAAGGKTTQFELRFLAVWRREEDGHWRLAMYQSAPLAAPAP